MRNVSLLLRVSCVDIRKRLSVSIQYLEAARYLLDLPGQWETA